MAQLLILLLYIYSAVVPLKPGFAGDIRAIEIWLIKRLKFKENFKLWSVFGVLEIPVMKTWLSFVSQPLKLDIKRKLSTRSARVKSMDLHPTEPWILISMFSGQVQIWNYESQVIYLLLTIGISELFFIHDTINSAFPYYKNMCVFVCRL